jgi:glycosyltransferase involved in cell wall biosynthesis
MVIIIYSAETEKSIQANMGLPEYSYFFVKKKFCAVLCKFAMVVEVNNPGTEVDIIYDECRLRGEVCLFFSFSPPHKTVTGLKCLTISVFAWEYSTIPTDTWGGDPRHDWRNVLREYGCAITHSSFAVVAVKKAMGNDFPVWSIPAPVWDDYTKLYKRENVFAQSEGFNLTFKGSFIDFNGCVVPSVPEESRKDFIQQRSSSKKDKNVSLHLKGIIYTTVFNPSDGRKNWPDLLRGFIWAFRKLEDVTLILKVICHDFEKVREILTDDIFKLMPFQCRVVILSGYLNDDEYAKLVRGSTYIVNSAFGEGQCLPLMEYMSAGKPAIAPSHTAMEDYINEKNSFVVKSNLERTIWPHDPREVLRTYRYQMNWESLYNAYLESYSVAKNDPGRYLRMSGHAVESLKQYCSKAVIEERLVNVFQQCGVSREVILSSTPIKEQIAFRRILLLRIWRFRLFSKESAFFREPVKNRLHRLLAFSRKCYVWFKNKSIAKMERLIEKYHQGRTSSER